MAPSTCPNEVTESGDENLWNPDVTRTWPQAPLLLPIFVCGSKTPVVRVKNRAALRLLSPTEGQSCSISFSKEIRFLQFWALRYSRLRWLDIYIYICRERERERERVCGHGCGSWHQETVPRSTAANGGLVGLQVGQEPIPIYPHLTSNKMGAPGAMSHSPRLRFTLQIFI